MCSGGGGGGFDSTSHPEQPWRNDPDVSRYYTPPADQGYESVWGAWEEAYYRYNKDMQMQMNKQALAAQYEMMHMQERLSKLQIATQKELHDKQMAMQEKLMAIQQEQYEERRAFEKEINAQRQAFEKKSLSQQEQMQREQKLASEQSKRAQMFNMGRSRQNRKNTGDILRSSGTRALQIGLNAPNMGSGGLAIPN